MANLSTGLGGINRVFEDSFYKSSSDWGNGLNKNTQIENRHCENRACKLRPGQHWGETEQRRHNLNPAVIFKPPGIQRGNLNGLLQKKRAEARPEITLKLSYQPKSSAAL